MTTHLDDNIELHKPNGSAQGAVLVLAGSSGRVERWRAQRLPRNGMLVAAMRWYGGPGQPRGICEVPLETFHPVLDELAGSSDNLAVLGTSKGAEAALLLAAADPRIRLVTAMAPTSVVWANVGPGPDGATYPYRSSWALAGEPLPFVSYDESWTAPDVPGPISFRELYLSSLEVDTERTARAAIRVERIEGEVIVSAGHDDQVWPSAVFCEPIAARRTAARLSTRVITHPRAGQRALFPDEPAAPTDGVMARGGDEAADRRLGAEVWAATLSTLGI